MERHEDIVKTLICLLKIHVFDSLGPCETLDLAQGILVTPVSSGFAETTSRESLGAFLGIPLGPLGVPLGWNRVVGYFQWALLELKP
jgi:hypothetical protein